MQNFYTELYRSLSALTVSSDFFTFDQPTFPGVFQELLYGVKKSYGETVLQTVMQVGQEDEDDIVLLVNYFLPELANTLAKQRRDYGLDPEIFPAQFPIAEHAEAIDDTPTNNMDMERLMAKAGQATDIECNKQNHNPPEDRAVKKKWEIRGLQILQKES